MITFLRQHIDQSLEKIGNVPNDHLRLRMIKILGRGEIATEYSRLDAFEEGYISGKGLSNHSDDIRYGLHQSTKHMDYILDSPLEPTDIESYKIFQRKLRAGTDSQMDFARNYIDRWKMYNKLFRNAK